MISLKGSRIVITGGAGFIGSHIADLLLEEEIDQIILIDNFTRGSARNVQRALGTGCVRLVEGDIRDRALLDRLFKGADFCFHMAALRINHCVSEPREALEVMFDGTFNVLEACVTHRIKKVVLASSASIYGLAESFPTRESHHPYNNRTLYGAGKLAAEAIFRSFHEMYGLDYNALRFFNVYGPRMDTHGKYTEVLIRWYHLIREGKVPVIYGKGDQTMDFVFVEDVARANILALKAEATDEVFNVASGEETSLRGLCDLLLETMNSTLLPEHVPVPQQRRKVEVTRRLADVSKAQALLSFRAEVSLRQGLARLCRWLDEESLMIDGPIVVKASVQQGR